MKKALTILLAFGVAGVAFCDIQSPPGSRDTPVRKLSRAIANIFYGVTEIPVTFEKTLKEEGGTAAFTQGVVEGADRAGMRFGYGLYELVNFRTPKYKESYRAPYARDHYDTVHGYAEYPPQVGFSSSQYVRSQSN